MKKFTGSKHTNIYRHNIWIKSFVVGGKCHYDLTLTPMNMFRKLGKVTQEEYPNLLYMYVNTQNCLHVTLCRSEGLVGGQSPLVRSTHSMMACSPVEPWKPLSSSALHLSNGLLDNAHLKTHSRTASSGSSIISDGLPSPQPTDSSLLPAITTIQHS